RHTRFSRDWSSDVCSSDLDFVYLRLHGSRELYASRYTDAEIAAWAARIRAWASGGQPADAACSLALAPPRRASRDVYCYFDNDEIGRASCRERGQRWGAGE